MAEFTHAKQIMDTFPVNFKPERAVGEEMVVQYLVEGPKGGNWIITVKDGTCTVVDGIADEPDVTCKVPDEVLLAISCGKMNGMQAVLTGKMKVIGNLAKMQKFQKWMM
jgi:putative sterol carrier protein